MMQLGFVSAILPDHSLEEVFATAAEIGYDCVEVMCWPVGKATRRYAGVTHIDATEIDSVAVEYIRDLSNKHHVTISAWATILTHFHPMPTKPSRRSPKFAR